VHAAKRSSAHSSAEEESHDAPRGLDRSLLTALIVPQHSVTAAKPRSITDLGTLGGD
jgi:hypothetical protein